MTKPPTLCYTVPTLANPANCGTLPDEAKMQGIECDPKPLDTAQCKKISDGGGGVCTASPEPAKATRQGETVGSSDQTNTVFPSMSPSNIQLNTPIPGFAPPKDMSLLLGTYVAAIYRYMISIGVFLTTVMFIWGAFRYLVGSGVGSVARGKQIMKDAIIGMILLFASNLILRTINPALVTFNSLKITPIATQYLDNYTPDGPAGNAGMDPINMPPKEETAKAIAEGAKLAGGDSCVILSICEHETGFRPIWNGYQNGKSREDAIAFGACGILTRYLHQDNPIARDAASKFSDFPLRAPGSNGQLSKADALAVGNWLLSNSKGDGYIAAKMFAGAVGKSGGNEITAVAAYGAGTGSMQAWAKANGCTPASGVKLANASASDLDPACVPHVVAIPNLGDSKTDASGQQVKNSQGCPEDKYVCSDAKTDASAQFVGHCSDGRKCYAMVTDAFAKYVIGAYPKMKSKYGCGL